ncbi:MAG: hypothetical protein OXN90_02820 [Gemmatimonadota bacterium]|nr:hypothetical protein [Gemmatimonadota bacterium]
MVNELIGHDADASQAKTVSAGVAAKLPDGTEVQGKIEGDAKSVVAFVGILAAAGLAALWITRSDGEVVEATAEAAEAVAELIS